MHQRHHRPIGSHLELLRSRFRLGASSSRRSTSSVCICSSRYSSFGVALAHSLLTRIPSRSSSSSATFSNGIHPERRTSHSCPCGVKQPGSNSKASSRRKIPAHAPGRPRILAPIPLPSASGLQLSLLLAFLLQQLPTLWTEHLAAALLPLRLGTTRAASANIFARNTESRRSTSSSSLETSLAGVADAIPLSR